MKKSLLIAASLLVVISGTAAFGETTYGKVDFVGTRGQTYVTNHYEDTLRFAVTGTCGTDTTSKRRWYHIRSGNTASQIANFRNTYDVLENAFTYKSSRNAQVDGLPSCTPSGFLLASDIWVGMY
jgi:hypothetical protein